MSRFTKNKITTAISTVLLLSSSFAFAADNLIQQGDFESGSIDKWASAGGVGAIINDADLSSNVLEVSGRTVHSSAAKYTVSNLVAGHTYLFTGKLKTDLPGQKVAMGTSYRLIDATSDIYVTIGTAVDSSGSWIDYSATFTLPVDFDVTKNFKIWIKSTGGEASTVYGDDFLLVDLDASDNPSSRGSLLSTYSNNDGTGDFWTINNLLDKKLDIMRLPVSDDLVNAVDGKTSTVQVTTWLESNTDWRWATYEEITALHSFFEDDDVLFLALNGNEWSPHATSQWVTLIATDAQTEGDASPAYRFTVKPGQFNNLGYGAATNANGLAAAALLVREVSDAVALEITAPVDISIEATASESTLSLGSPVITGGVAPVEAAVADNTGPFSVGEHTVTWSVTDADFVTVTITQTVTVTDTTEAAFDVLDDYIVEATAPSTTFSMLPVNANDLVDGDIAATNDATASYAVGNYVINWSATDTAGNEAITTQNLIVQDTTKPAFDSLADIEIEINGGQAGVVIPAVMATDAVDVSIAATRDIADGSYDAGVYNITWTAIDTAGNEATAIQKLIITDIGAAVAFDHDGALATISLEASSNLSSVVLTPPTANDGEITATADNLGPFAVGTHTITWTATEGDDAISQVQTIIVTDSTAPIFAELAEIHFEATGAETDISLADISASDLVDGDVVATNDAPSTLPLGSHDITWTATDAAGNPSTKIQKVIVEDTTAPVIADVAPLIVEATGIESTISLTAPVVSDLVDGSPVMTNDAPDVFPLGDTTVTWTAIDADDNTITADQLITVQDTSAPVFAQLPTLEFDVTDADTASVVIPGVTAFDAVNGEISASGNFADGEYAPGTYEITWTVVDSVGNSSQTTQFINIVEEEVPAEPVSGENLIKQSDFDDTAFDLWLSAGGVAGIFNDAVLASNVLEVSGRSKNSSAAKQQINNLIAGHSYQFTGKLRTENDGGTVGIGISFRADLTKDDGSGKDTFLTVGTLMASAGTWVDYQGEFTLPEAFDSAMPFKLWIKSGGAVVTNVYGDDLTLIDLDAVEVIDSDGDGYSDNEDAFPNDATEWLDTDGDLLGNNTDIDDDGDGVDDVNDAFPLDSSETIDTDGDGTGDNADTDDDGDGVTDEEDAFPLDSSETVDTDGDGMGNNVDTDDDNDGVLDVDDAFPEDAEKWQDETDPELLAPADVTIDARGKYTLISQHSVGPVQAIDNADGVIDAVVVGETKLPSGRHQVTWRATDTAGNYSEVTQIVNINPLVNFALDKLAEPGSEVTARIILSGEAPSYPIELDLVVGGTASDSIHSAVTQILTITVDALATEYTFTISPEAEILGGETIELTLIAATNAALGTKVTHTTTLVADNVAPIVSISMKQGDNRTLVLSKDSVAPVIVTAQVRDANLVDRGNHSLSWSASDQVIVDLMTDEDASTFEFDVSSLSAGLYSFEVTATESREEDALSSTTNFSFVIVDSLPELIAEADSDNDGIADTEEGTGDSDGDGIADYLDNEDDVSILSLGNGKSLRTQSGLKLKLGRASLIAKGLSADGAAITTDDLMALGNSLGIDTSNIEDANYSSVGDIIDFELSGLLAVGTTASVIIPLADGDSIPAEAVYRKYNIDSGWSNFVADNDNTIASAPVTPAGLCPEVGSTDYEEGLNEGDNCIELTLLDGGEYDQDGIANGVIVDPAKIATDARTFYANSAVSDGELNEGEMITLDVSLTETGDQELTYTWQQVSGTAINLPTDNETVTITTEVPQVRGDEDIVIEVTVSNGSQYDVTVMSFTALQTEAIITPIVSIDGANQSGTLAVGSTVSLDASASFDSDNNALTYTWLQTSGPQVVLSDYLSSTPSFVVPEVGSDVKMVFEVSITNGLDTQNATNTASVEATIEGNYKESSGGSTGLWSLILLAVGFVRRKY